MKISLYSNDSSPSLADKLIGTDVNDSSNTKNFLLSDVAALINESTQFAPVLNAASTIAQVPSGVGVATQVTFGGAQSNSTLRVS